MHSFIHNEAARIFSRARAFHSVSLCVLLSPELGAYTDIFAIRGRRRRFLLRPVLSACGVL